MSKKNKSSRQFTIHQCHENLKEVQWFWIMWTEKADQSLRPILHEVSVAPAQIKQTVW